MSTEFELIRRFFTRATPTARLGIGDDAAVLAIPAGEELVISTDMLVSGRHFLPDVAAEDLGHKALAVNLSDMAAMGATPRWVCLALALPEADVSWIERFAEGWFALARRHGVELVGGDTTRGPLNLTPTILGTVPANSALRRDAACADDDIWVSGTLGAAALGLAHLLGPVDLPEPLRSNCLRALHRPEPRVALGAALRGVARACIDVSDGLVADLGHIGERSGLSALIDAACLPMVEIDVPAGGPSALQAALSGGDDYELCFTAAPTAAQHIQSIAHALECRLTRIGSMLPGRAGRVTVRDSAGRDITPAQHGFDHFA